MKLRESNQYYEGYAACKSYLSPNSCPYIKGSAYQKDWHAGYDACLYEKKSSEQHDNANQQFESLATKPVAVWNGEGLPPVGTECEWLASGDHDWIGVKVLAYHEDEVWLQPLNGAQSFTVGNPDEFRPIRSKEERKREEIISDLMNALGHAHGLFDLNQIYNALSSGVIRHVKVEVSDE